MITIRPYLRWSIRFCGKYSSSKLLLLGHDNSLVDVQAQVHEQLLWCCGSWKRFHSAWRP